jgi:hypothetical protein
MGPMKSMPHFMKGSAKNIVINFNQIGVDHIALLLAIITKFAMVTNI